MSVPDPTTNIVEYVLFALTAMLTAALGAMVYLLRKRADGNGKLVRKTFADDPRAYWLEMREVVTQPLAEVLKETNSVLKELRDHALKETAAREERERILRDKNGGI